MQILFGVLLTVPFQSRFGVRADGQRHLFLGVLRLVAAATLANGVHRTALVLGVAPIVSVVVDTAAPWVAATSLAVLLVVGWAGLPAYVGG